jgi:hypothetical protein
MGFGRVLVSRQCERVAAAGPFYTIGPGTLLFNLEFQASRVLETHSAGLPPSILL